MMNVNENHGKKAIITGSIFGFLGFVLNVVSGLVLTPWMIRILGNSNYGLFTLSNSLISIFLIDFGLSKTVNVFISRFRANGQEERVSGFVGLIFKIYIAIDLAILIAFATVYFLIPNIYIGLSPLEQKAFQIIFLITATFSLLSFPTSIFTGVLSSYEKFTTSKVIDILTKIIHIILSILVLFLTGNVFLSVFVNALMGLLSNILKYIYVRLRLRIRVNIFVKNESNSIKSVFIFSAWAFISALAGRFLLAFVPNILGIVSNSESIAVFGVASSLENYVFLFGNITSGFFLPMIARINSENDLKKRQEKFDENASKTAKIQFFMIALVFCGFICCGQAFINIWIKDAPEYNNAFLCTILLVIPNLIFVPQAFQYSTMYEKNMVKFLAIPEIIGGFVNIGLCFLFGYFFGTVGACFSICVSRLFIMALQTYFYKKKASFDTWSIFKNSFLPIIINSTIATIISLMIGLLIQDNLYLKLFISGFVLVHLFVIFNISFGFSKDEKTYYFEAIKGALKFHEKKK